MDNSIYREQVADLLLKDPITGEDLFIVSSLRSEKGGLQSFDAQADKDSPKWRIQFRVSEV